MANPQKDAAIAELAEKFRSSSAAVITEYRGLTVAQLGELRSKLRGNATYSVVKNTLTEIAAREAIEKARIQQDRVVTDARIANEEETRRREIERTRAVDEAEIAAREATEKARIAQTMTVNVERISSDERTRALEIQQVRTIQEDRKSVV